MISHKHRLNFKVTSSYQRKIKLKKNRHVFQLTDAGLCTVAWASFVAIAEHTGFETSPMPKVFQTIFGLFYIHFVNNTSFACSDDDVKFCLHTTTNNNTASLNQMSLF